MFHRLTGKHLGIICLLLAPYEFWLLLISDFPHKYRTFPKWLTLQKLLCVNICFTSGQLEFLVSSKQKVPLVAASRSSLATGPLTSVPG